MHGLKINFDDIDSNRLFDKMIDDHIPNMAHLKNIFEKNEWHDETTYDHIKNVFINMNALLTRNKNINVDREVLYYVVLYHDIGKSETLKINDNGTTSFPGHELASSRMLPERELIHKLGEKRFTFLKNLIEKHSNIHKILDDKENYLKLLENYRKDSAYAFLENIIFTLCDIRNSHLLNTNIKEYDFRINTLQSLIPIEHSQQLF